MKKELFKLAIREFHERGVPSPIQRDLNVPIESRKIITIYGPRRAGKTYYLYQLIHQVKTKVPLEKIVFLNFEDERLLPLNARELATLIEAYYELYPLHKGQKIYFFFDEIQIVDGWESFVRRLHDTQNFQIFLSGSSAKLLSREIASSLRGRTLAYRILPLSFREFLRFKEIDYQPEFLAYSDLRFEIKHLLEKEYLLWGGYPEVVLEDQSLRLEILRNYFEMIVFRDIVDRFAVRNTKFLKFFLKYLLTNVATLFSINKFYRSLEGGWRPSRETLLDYLSYILETETIFLTSKFSYSLKIQEKNPKKIYSVDNGLRQAAAFVFSEDYGRLAENVVFQELLRRGYEVFYWKNKGEVDFIAQKDSKTFAINVTFGLDLPERELKALKKLKEEFPKLESLLITRDTKGEKEGIKILPLWQWLLFKFDSL